MLAHSMSDRTGWRLPNFDRSSRISCFTFFSSK
uniref:Uncharacterized protein n=1 Tax=Arundo donax TaxID=35708 RepID=A0A0A9CME2_ARUDO